MAPARSALVGIDVGSTTAKAALLDESGALAAHGYVRHAGEPAKAVAKLLASFPRTGVVRCAFTGSLGQEIADRTRHAHVHEVSAVAAAVERRVPSARAVFELGGQDAKFIRIEVTADGARCIDANMNDRCAAGTGVTIDRILDRLQIDGATARTIDYAHATVRTLSSKCGVFAETDAVNFARMGVPHEALVSSVADAIATNNLALLTRGEIPEPDVVLLGGPIVFLPALAQAFAHKLGARWSDRACSNGARVIVPDHALLFAAMGAAWLAEGPRADAHDESIDAIVRALRAPARVAAHVSNARPIGRPRDVLALVRNGRRAVRVATKRAASFTIGIDAGSTRTKAVVVDSAGTIVAQSSRRSGDPVADARGLFDDLARQLPNPAVLTAARIGVTGYGADLVASIVGAETRVLETVAHARAARHFVPDADVVCDVGGQDVKVIALAPDGAIRDFRISNQCSAGIGMVLESTAREFGIALDQFARQAFAAERAPDIAANCVVFLDSNRIGLQREGFTAREILAGLALALPRVVWSHVMAGTPPARLGRTFVLQGGVQRNFAALVAQARYLHDHVPGARVCAHPHAAEAGAFGAALEARDAAPKRRSPHPVPDAVSIRSDEGTRCSLCDNHCSRALVTLRVRGATETIVSGNACEAGGFVDDRTPAARAIPAARRRNVPNVLSDEARRLFARTQTARAIRSAVPMRVGIPRTLPMYRSAPFFRGYLEALGVAPRNVFFSPFTSEALVRDGGCAGATDPCFPAKATFAHVRWLLREHDRGRALDALLVPRFTHAITPVRHTVDCASCPVVTALPAAVRATFRGVTDDALGARGIRLVDDTVTMTDARTLRAQMFAALGEWLGATRDESDRAVEIGLDAMREIDRWLQARADRVLDELARDPARGAVLVLCRPYHADPGIQHHASDEIQALGYPVLTIRSLPRDPDRLARLFASDLAAGAIEDPFDVRDLLAECDNSGASERLWAARFAAAHGQLGVLDLSSFKCGQDAPTFAPIRTLFDRYGVVTCNLHDLDETRPHVSLRLRLKTFAHALAERGLRAW